jgi:raffinose/stachyose/melibiose transport system permease protein
MESTKLRSGTTVRIILSAILLLFVVINIYPIVWVIQVSLKTSDELMNTSTYSLPRSLYLGNYVKGLQESNIARAYLNSTVIAAITLLMQVMVSSPAAFAIKKLRFRLGKPILSFFMMGMMIPVFVCLIPMFKIYNLMGLNNTYLSVILPQIGFRLPLCIYMYVGFLTFLPDDLLEATVVDGCSTLQTFLHIVVPMSNNTTVTIIIFQFLFVWNEFTFANTFLISNSMKTLPVCLKDFVGVYGQVDWPATYAVISMSIIPTLIIYFILNKSIMEGVSAGAVKY